MRSYANDFTLSNERSEPKFTSEGDHIRFISDVMDLPGYLCKISTCILCGPTTILFDGLPTKCSFGNLWVSAAFAPQRWDAPKAAYANPANHEARCTRALGWPQKPIVTIGVRRCWRNHSGTHRCNGCVVPESDCILFSGRHTRAAGPHSTVLIF